MEREFISTYISREHLCELAQFKETRALMAAICSALGSFIAIVATVVCIIVSFHFKTEIENACVQSALEQTTTNESGQPITPAKAEAGSCGFSAALTIVRHLIHQQSTHCRTQFKRDTAINLVLLALVVVLLPILTRVACLRYRAMKPQEEPAPESGQQAREIPFRNEPAVVEKVTFWSCFNPLGSFKFARQRN
ncbi:hypothetical protein SISNIDRAFT_450707 [Sistotremastrum niveocremeum HHB9708]|uniref:Uncharacterized protein n=1 Tax=Sistotremastrum niveocremeum HHB9708 TaxID=1314777 RepID=A0A164YI17_9AGAM|nr:hypothetical protein SISNIDRAFT_450707 [Sistotremastrum niveocremeum HHB9708]